MIEQYWIVSSCSIWETHTRPLSRDFLRETAVKTFYELRRTREIFVVSVIVAGILANYYTRPQERESEKRREERERERGLGSWAN